MCTPVMGISLWGAILCWISPLCETASLKELSVPNDNSDWQSTRLGEGTYVRQGVGRKLPGGGQKTSLLEFARTSAGIDLFVSSTLLDN